jgi:hypothetical protein
VYHDGFIPQSSLQFGSDKTDSIALCQDSENTLLLLKSNDLAEVITKVRSIAGGLLFIMLLTRFFVEIGTNSPLR